MDRAYVDRAYADEETATKVEAHSIQLEVVKHSEARRGFVLLPRRWVRRAQLRLGYALHASCQKL